MVEFTGERVVPDQVNPDLWSEHLARYAFARRYVHGKRVLDCGCGTGYGSAELAQDAADVIGIDLSTDAIEYARLNYSGPNTRYIIGSCLELGFPAESFDVLVAFEVIEHLREFRRFLDESARVLTLGGLFIVSTPNKSYYAESRAESGPNPFHEHEFEAEEFQAELSRAFPHLDVLLQNRVECFTFAASGFELPEARVDGGGGPATDAHFFIALCSKSPIPQPRSFIYVPTAANLLREREQHIRLLEDQLRRTESSLAATQEERNRLLSQYRQQLAAYDKQKEELEARNRWAETLNVELRAAYQRIDQVQHELAAEQQASAETAAAYESKVRDLEAENLAKTNWAIETEERLTTDFDRAVQLLSTAEQTVVERTIWAQQLERDKQALETQLNAVRESRWVRTGRKLGLGPQL